MSKIKKIVARELLDSRGNPTIEVEMESDTGLKASAIVPSGASTGEYEAVELRDNDENRFDGKGVLRACDNVANTIAPAIEQYELGGQPQFDQMLIDLDGTENKSNLGANAILGCSMAYARLSAADLGQNLYETLDASKEYSLPTPMMNVINGGQHADSGLEIQEFMLMPTGIADFKEKLRCGVEIFHTLKGVLKENGFTVSVGDEGGFAPKLESNEKALDYLIEAIEKAGYKPGIQVNIALDAAASEFYEEGLYKIKVKGELQTLSSYELTEYYKELCKQYPIISIEDGHSEHDWQGWIDFTEEFGNQLQIVGDDLLVTNSKKITQAIEKKACNSVLIKLNQIGTVTETINAIKISQQAGFTTVISHRSGETEDCFIADLAVGLNAKQIKTGSLSRTDRVAKYNQLLRIYEEIA